VPGSIIKESISRELPRPTRRRIHFKIDFMILTKELRFGNKVKTRKGQVITVQQILSNSIIYDTKIAVHRELVPFGASRNNDYHTQMNEIIKEADCNDIEPIPLNEDILRQCGFKTFLRELWTLKINNSHFDWEFLDGKLRLRNPAPCLNSIQYLHQLQNFLYATANHEIEFKSVHTVLL
jgi:hypothetical protein